MSRSRSKRRGRPSNLTGAFAQLAEAVGGVAVLAAKAHVSRWTVPRWCAGSQPCEGPARAALLAVAAKHGLEAAIVAQLEAASCRS